MAEDIEIKSKSATTAIMIGKDYNNTTPTTTSNRHDMTTTATTTVMMTGNSIDNGQQQ